MQKAFFSLRQSDTSETLGLTQYAAWKAESGKREHGVYPEPSEGKAKQRQLRNS